MNKHILLAKVICIASFLIINYIVKDSVTVRLYVTQSISEYLELSKKRVPIAE